MNLKDLSTFDIKDLQNIDINEIKDFFLQRVDISINILLIVTTLSVIMYSYNNKNARMHQLTVALAEKQAKVQEMDGNAAVTTEYADFLAGFPTAISDDRLSNALSEFAVTRQVQIQSFSPLSKQRDTYRANNTAQIKIASKEYANIINFMKDIESAPYAIRVIKWDGTMQQASSSQAPQGTKTGDLIIAEITIESISLLNE